MDIDFHSQYKALDNIALLKIVRQPAQYQAAAVAAATRILSERTVTEEEMVYVDDYLKAINDRKAAKAAVTSKWEHKLRDFFEPVLNPGQPVADAKWGNLFVLLVCLWYGYTALKKVKLLAITYYYTNSGLDAYPVFMLVNTLFIIAFCVLLYRRSYWGWILLALQEVLLALSNITLFWQWFSERGAHTIELDRIFWPVVECVLFVYLLWRAPIIRHFNMTAQRRRTLMWVGVLVVARGIILYIYKNGVAG